MRLPVPRSSTTAIGSCRRRSTKAFDDGVKEHRFIRVDTHASKDDAVSFSITKAQQIIDEQGDRLFRNA